MTRNTKTTNQLMTDYDDHTRDELIERIGELETQLETTTTTSNPGGYSRRSVLATAAGIAAAGAAGVYATGSVTADPSGTFPQSGDDPLLKIRADRIRLVPRTSDPSNPAGGTMWVVE